MFLIRHSRPIGRLTAVHTQTRTLVLSAHRPPSPWFAGAESGGTSISPGNAPPSSFSLVQHPSNYSPRWHSTTTTSPKMVFEKFNGLEIAAMADMHVHLRDGAMMELVVPTIRKGGANTVMVMPNLVPPITTVAHALDYKKRLQALEPNVGYIMSLYLHPEVTPEIIKEAAAAGITNVKSYPAGVTTNSSAGVVDYAAFYSVFEEMERQNMILNLHGELPPTKGKEITVMNAEEAFLPTLIDLHRKFPNLRVILEHCTTAAAIAAVRSCGPSVAATITAHHLYLTVDDVVGNCYNFCKPVAKLPSDRKALLEASISGDPKFFFGTDSAPHPVTAKEKKGAPAAGCFTQAYATQLVMDALELAVERELIEESKVTPQVLEDFLGNFGRKFYGVENPKNERIVISKKGETVTEGYKNETIELANFRAGAETWTVEWK